MDKAQNEKLFENVYRTRDYIVKQELYLIVNAEQNNAVLSVDTYYRRTLCAIASISFCIKTVNTSMAKGFRRIRTFVPISTKKA